MIIYTPPALDRESDCDSFTVLGNRMDALSFHNHPFAASCLGHRWASTYNEANSDTPLITKLRPELYLTNSREPNNDFIKDWGVSMPEVEEPRYDDERPWDYAIYHRQFFNGDLSNEADLGKELEADGSDESWMGWVATLFCEKAWGLLKPVVRSAEKGNASAIMAISWLTHRLTSSLERITRCNGEEVRKISANRFYWPVLHSPHSQLQTDQKDSYIANLRLGSKLPVRVDHARWVDNSLSTLTLELISFIDRLRTYPKVPPTYDPNGRFEGQCELGEVCWALPKLTKESAKSHWWPVVREIFSFSYPDPLGVEEFRQMVQYGQDSSGIFRSAFLKALKEKLISLSKTKPRTR
jgi:hypothetical protein